MLQSVAFSAGKLEARPLSRLVDASDQVVEPSITEITCLRSHELMLFHLLSACIGSAPGDCGLTGGLGLAAMAGPPRTSARSAATRR